MFQSILQKVYPFQVNYFILNQLTRISCLQVVSNIPFNISTDIIKQLLPMGDIFSEVVLLLQVLFLTFEEQVLYRIGTFLFVVNSFYLVIFKTYFRQTKKERERNKKTGREREKKRAGKKKKNQTFNFQFSYNIVSVLYIARLICT